ncbi:MAG: ionic transporter, partial [Rhizobiales bacterium]|nr:ionic transporter [Hyphomicrobiales bacterium]
MTIIEVTIVASMMLHDANYPTLAREAVYSVVMIVCNGVVGLCLLLGRLRYGGQDLRPRGTSAFLAVLMALSVLTLVLPNYTLTTEGPTFAPSQLLFIGVISILLYGAFLFAQTIRHRDDFMEVGGESDPHHAYPPPSRRRMLVYLIGLLASLAGVVLLAERVADWIESSLDASGLQHPDALIGAVVALMVLLPEALSAIRAAARNALQTSLNVALGSAVATIGLTIPAVA